MKKIFFAAGAAIMLLSAALLDARQDFKTLDAVRIDGDSVVVMLSGLTQYRAFKIENPPRLVFECMNTEYNAPARRIGGNGTTIERIRGGQYKNEPVKIARIVIDLKKDCGYTTTQKGRTVAITLENGRASGNTPNTAALKAAVNMKPVQGGAAAANHPLTAKRPAAATTAPVKAMERKTAEPAKETKSGMKLASAMTVPRITVVNPATRPPVPVTAEAVKPAIAGKTVAAETVKPKDDVEEVIAQPIVPEAPAKKASGVKKQDAVPPAAPVKGGEEKKEPVSQARGEQPVAAAKKTTAVAQRDETATSHVVLPKKPVTLDFEDVDIRDVFRILSMKSGINIIYGSDVSGTITLRLENVPFDRAFETILSLKNLVSQEQPPNIIRIVTPQKIADERMQAVTFTKIFPLNYAKADEVKSNLDNIRNAEGRKGNVSVDDRTNSLIVTDTPQGLESVESIIGELDRKPQQVIIEARIVEIGLTNNLDLGINWNYARTLPTADGVMTVGQTSIQTTDKLGTGGTAVNGEVRTPDGALAGGTGVSFPAGAINGQVSSIAFGLVSDSSRLTAVINALAQKGLSKILSNPKVTTINNRQARILVGQKIPYTTTTVSTSGSTQQTNFLEVGVKLSVTPTINMNRKITLNVHPEVSLYVRSDPAGPVIGTREAETTVIVSNGETVVIGGLITENDQKMGTQVPLLGDIPIIGHLFKRDFNTKERTELLVFLTPQIIE